MANYFDQFDSTPSVRTKPTQPVQTRPESSNYFDRFDGMPTEVPKTPQMKLKDYIKNFVQDAVGTAETAASMGTGLIGTVAGDVAGGLQAVNNFATPWVPDSQKTNPSDVRNTIQSALTYKPQTAGGERVSNTLAPAMDVLSYIPRQVGAAAESLGASPYVRDLTTDVAGVVLPIAATKGVQTAAPVASKAVQAAKPVVSKAVEAAKPVVSKAGKALVKGIDVGTNPQLHQGLAAYNAMTGNIPGALGHVGVVAGRTLVDKMRGVETPPITIQSVGAQLADAVIDRATTNPVLRKAAKAGLREGVSEGIQKAATTGARVTTAVSPAEAIITAVTGEATKANRVRSRNPGSGPDVMSMADEGGYKAPGMKTEEESMDALFTKLGKDVEGATAELYRIKNFKTQQERGPAIAKKYGFDSMDELYEAMKQNAIKNKTSLFKERMKYKYEDKPDVMSMADEGGYKGPGMATAEESIDNLFNSLRRSEPDKVTADIIREIDNIMAQKHNRILNNQPFTDLEDMYNNKSYQDPILKRHGWTKEDWDAAQAAKISETAASRRMMGENIKVLRKMDPVRKQKVMAELEKLDPDFTNIDPNKVRSIIDSIK